jgi:hypothetical protein
VIVERNDLGRSVARALRALLDEARRNGCANPKLFFESESAAVFVLDGDHPGYVNADKRGVGAGGRQEAIVVRAAISTPFDVGAW